MKKHGNEKWNYDLAKKAAASCSTRTEFKKKFSGAAKWATRNNVLNDICSHMTPMFRWTFDLVKKESIKYKSKNEFHKENPSAAQWAKKNNLMDSLFENKLNSWDFTSVFNEALKYSSREEFRKNASGAVSWASRNGLLDSVCSHMEHLNKTVTLDEAQKEALKFNTRSEFCYWAPRAYAWALRNNCLDDICSHMVNGKNVSDKDLVYMWSPKEMNNVFKFGVSSSRLADKRIKIVARSGGLQVDFCTARLCKNAKSIERMLLSIGKPIEWPEYFNGCNEFRILTPSEINKAFEIISPYEELTS